MCISLSSYKDVHEALALIISFGICSSIVHGLGIHSSVVHGLAVDSFLYGLSIGCVPLDA